MSDTAIRLALPALPEYGRIARLTAASVCLRHGFTYQEVEDLRIAIDEAIILLLGYEAHEGQIVVTFELEPDETISVEAVAEFADVAAVTDEDLTHRFSMLVTDLVDESDFDPLARAVRLRKHHVEAA